MRTKLLIILSIMLIALTGCGKDELQEKMLIAQSEGKEIHLSIPGEAKVTDNANIAWIELDQLTSGKPIRSLWDNEFNIVRFDTSSKNGILYIDLDGNWAGNNTLFNVYQNKVFHEYWAKTSITDKLYEKAIDTYKDIENNGTAKFAAINTYFNIIPINEDKTSGLMNTLTRAEAMAALVKGDTQVIYVEPEDTFLKVVGGNPYNNIAVHALEYMYLDYKNESLCADTYNSPITRAEVIYYLVQKHFKDDYDKVNVSGVSFTDCTNAGNVAEKLGLKDGHAWQAYELEYCLQTSKTDCPEQLYKALAVAYKNGIIGSETKWNQTLRGGDLLSIMVNTYQAYYNKHDFTVNAKAGKNVGQSLIKVETKDNNEINKPSSGEQIGGVIIEEVKDVTSLENLYKVYADEINMTDAEKAEAEEIARKWTFKKADKWLQVGHCGYLNIRKGPSTDYSIIKSVPKGTKCHIVAVCEENGWYRILYNGKVYYQCGVYFTEIEE